MNSGAADSPLPMPTGPPPPGHNCDLSNADYIRQVMSSYPSLVLIFLYIYSLIAFIGQNSGRPHNIQYLCALFTEKKIEGNFR